MFCFLISLSIQLGSRFVCVCVCFFLLLIFLLSFLNLSASNLSPPFLLQPHVPGAWKYTCKHTNLSYLWCFSSCLPRECWFYSNTLANDCSFRKPLGVLFRLFQMSQVWGNSLFLRKWSVLRHWEHFSLQILSFSSLKLSICILPKYSSSPELHLLHICRLLSCSF